MNVIFHPCPNVNVYSYLCRRHLSLSTRVLFIKCLTPYVYTGMKLWDRNSKPSVLIIWYFNLCSQTKRKHWCIYQHPESGNNSDSIKSQDTNAGVLVNNIQCLTIGHLNVGSLLPKIDEIRCILNSYNFDVFAVCESWLNQTIMDSKIVVDGYTVHRKDRPNSICGGVCLYVYM